MKKIFIHPITILILVSATIAEDSSRSSKQSNLRRRRLLTDTVTFDDPTHHGKLLDYCLTFKNDCGKPAADAYCAEKDYGEAVYFPKRRTYDRETLTIENHSTCTPEHNSCDTFDYITCKVKEQTFENPREHDRPLDGCLKYETQCGLPAANAYCKDKGYSKAIEYSQIEVQEGETMSLGDHSVCDPKWHGCSTFSYITCFVS